MNKLNLNNNEKIKNLAIQAQNLYKEQKYLDSYSLYKFIFRKFNELRVLPNLIDIIFISTKKNLIKNRNLKFKLINLLINFGLNKDNGTSLSNELIYLRLKLLREFKKFEEFQKLFESIDISLKNVIFVQFEYLHYLLECEKFDEAEIILNKIKKNKKDFYKNLQFFFIDKNMFELIKNSNFSISHDIVLEVKKNNDNYNYIVVVSGTYNIFKSEILTFIKSLKKTSKNYLFSLLIHDSTDYQKKDIVKEINNIDVDNYLLFFESSQSLSLNSFETKTYYTARRYLLVNDLMEEFNKPIFLFDADSIICKNLDIYLNLNKNYDMSLHIKEELRYFQTSLTANQSLFLNTKNSRIFLNFYKKYIYYILKNKKLRWHIDQIVLYVSFIIIKRFYYAKIRNNAENNFKNDQSFFYHTFHNKYLL
ncbi:MAG: hypothetical protein CBD97_00475 [Pelagibacteraceae bacterium TMED237]|nr:MAG: hypothetical protein CBD97_00475 [Pelagibacteraceae bacterium TMED237]|tara:strand:- start:313 stop:1575 length:1263 start_codon:yes stop_codon:yes gene_type:complete